MKELKITCSYCGKTFRFNESELAKQYDVLEAGNTNFLITCQHCNVDNELVITLKI